MSQTQEAMQAHVRAGQQSAQVADTETPKGTVAILAAYAVVIIGLWGHMFLTMLQRGVK